ncbi:glycoside hydrolase family 15 protein [Rubritalea marina]|uniref:glycoside hydrolase family 15 protein n=1 Tax=Rubritalea marina TaxID=361055 RepID=UPI0003675F23|nr:glycoside hydrolase family 15 protein [Rubritalea marina]
MSDDNYNHAIIGNGRSCALIDDDSSIVFCCLPDFDSGTVFAKILDEERGGTFGLSQVQGNVKKQAYVNKTAIFKTTFEGPDGSFEVIDFMPKQCHETEYANRDDAASDIVRIIRPLDGSPKVNINYDPKLEYARFPTHSESYLNNSIKSTSIGQDATGARMYESCYLYTNVPHDVILDGGAFTLEEPKFFILSYHDKIVEPDQEIAELLLQATHAYWLQWTARTHYSLKYRDEVLRSAITLKLLQFSPTGAVLAAATTSLPETIGEVRNWDYRFCWVRDGSMTIDVLHQIGHKRMAKRFINWLIHTAPTKDDNLQIMYGIRGEKQLTEETLEHLSGYLGSAPVRIGNAAYKQKQHDIYGILMDLIYRDLESRGVPTNTPTPEALDRRWTQVRSIVKSVEEHWRDPDRGIWEIRGEGKHFVFSKVLCWVAVDRAIKFARIIGKFEWADQQLALRDAIHDDVYERGWNDKIGAFSQTYGCDHLDASNLLMAEYGFIDHKNPRFISTVKASNEQLCKNGLLFRYINTDDFGEPTSAFSVCSFWMVKALAKCGMREEAKRRFDELLSYANPHGLYGEDLDFETKRHLGNFPQAYCHLALIDCALEIDKHG